MNEREVIQRELKKEQRTMQRQTLFKQLRKLERAKHENRQGHERASGAKVLSR